MVRYKFPGKPSKFSNRTLVNANCSTAHENESARAATLICYGLSIFTETFGPDEDESDEFIGFGARDVARSRERARVRIAEIEEEHKNRGVVFIPLDKRVENRYFLLSTSSLVDDKNDGDSVNSEVVKSCNNDGDSIKSTSVKKAVVKRPVAPVKRLGANSCNKHNNNNNNYNCNKRKRFKVNRSVSEERHFKNSSCDYRNSKQSNSCVFDNDTTLSNREKNVFSLKTEKLLLSENSIDGYCDKSPDRFSASRFTFSNGNYNKKNFILPSHSVRSSRVIKPNKRFLDNAANDVVGISPGSGRSSRSSTSGYEFGEPFANDNRPPAIVTPSGSSIELKKPRLVLGPNHEFPNFTWSRSRDDTSMVSDVESETSSLRSSVTSTSSGSSIVEPPPKKKVILRKSRLNIDTSPTADAIFKSGAIRGKVVCGVCSAVRFYRFVRQARKFGIYSCEPCRNFITKMINNFTQKVKCLGEKGQCHVPPVMRTTIWDSRKQMVGKVRNLRCQACWLKMCINCYFMPEQLKLRLNNKLPIFMRDPILSAKKIKIKRMYTKRQIGAVIADSDLNDDNLKKKEISIRETRLEERIKRKSGSLHRISRKRQTDSSITSEKEIKRRGPKSKLCKEETYLNDSSEEILKDGTSGGNSNKSVINLEKNVKFETDNVKIVAKKKTINSDCLRENACDSFSKSTTKSTECSASSTVKVIENHLTSPKLKTNYENGISISGEIKCTSDDASGNMFNPSPVTVPKKRGRKKKIRTVGDAAKPVPVVAQEIRQKRKAALNSLANIARVTGRVTCSAVENQLIIARNLKKKAAAIARKELDSTMLKEKMSEVKKDKTAIVVKRRRRGKSNLEKQKHGSDGRVVNVPGRNSGSIILQGPRVKHVCRSASLVLGRQIATFTSKVSPPKSKQLDSSPAKEVTKVSLPSCDSSSNNHVVSVVEAADQSHVSSRKESINLSPILSLVPVSTPSTTVSVNGSILPPVTVAVSTLSAVSVGRMKQPSISEVVSVAYKDESLPNGKAKPKTSIARTLQDLGRQNCELLDGIGEEAVAISIDFWESYDPDEVGKTGFALIGCDASFRVASLCFLCGSAGVDKMVHCVCCCEPYHLYCVEGGMNDYLKLQRSRLWWRVDWVCPRCAICNICSKGDGHHLTCNKCRKSYHTDCLPHDKIVRVHASERPWVCHLCLRCKSCNAKSVAMFVGNIPLCNSCFKLRQKGSFCPLCQRCYDDDDFDTSMMECGKCKSWVHAKCEGLSSEKYQVLSFLPDSVEFICRLCCTTSPAPWWLAVEAELNAGYLSVLKSLTKNRKVCELLKYSPKKRSESSVCTCQNPQSLPIKRSQDSIHSLVTLDENVMDTPIEDFSSRDQRPQCCPSEEVSVLNVTSCSDSNHSNVLDPLPSAGEGKSETECLEKRLIDLSSSNAMKPNIYNNLVNNTQLSKSDRDSINVKSVSTNVLPNVICDTKTKLPNMKDCLVPSVSVSTSNELHIKLSDNDQQMLPARPGIYHSLENKVEQFSPHATSQSDSGIGSTDDELKMSIDDNETINVTGRALPIPLPMEGDLLPSPQCGRCCSDSESESKVSPSLLCIKHKVNCKEYLSLQGFHNDMQRVVGLIKDSKLLDFYYQTLQDVFPWFDPRCSQVHSAPSRNDSSVLCDYNYVDCNDTGFIRKRYIDYKKEETDDVMSKDMDYFEEMSVVLNDLLGLPQSYYYYNIDFTDTRICVLCKTTGDASSESEGRLLYCGHNEWIHANCALWSNEVYEEIDGSLQRVHSAISRSRLIRCAFCGKRGATVGCCYRNCPESYHFPCAVVGHCVFMEDKSIYCYLHQNESKSKPLSKQSDFAITRPIYVELMDLEKKRKKSVPHSQVKVMIGSLLVDSLGEFVDKVSDQELSIVPCEFSCTRLYWSSVEPWRLVRYHIRTKILKSTYDYSVVKDDNFTVDHSLDTKNEQFLEVNDEPDKLSPTDVPHTVDDNEVKRVLYSVVDAVCNVGNGGKDDESIGNLITDPQNSADLLPPELKDAIFEDLPKDILDGISMQDIFPKLMTYDDGAERNDIIDTGDLKNSNAFTNINKNIQKLPKSTALDKSSSSKLKTSTTNTSLNSESAKSEEKPKAVVKPESNKNVTLFTDNTNSNSINTSESELKSCDSTKQHRKILQVDGALDYTSNDSDTGSPNRFGLVADTACYNPVLFVRIQNTSDLKYLHTKEDINTEQILQVDGCVDNSECESTTSSSYDPRYSDSDLSDRIMNWKESIPQLDGTSDCNASDNCGNKDLDEEEPVKCLRCHRTYRTAVSYERHLSTCHTDYMSCSESDSSEEEKMLSSPLNEYCLSGRSVCNSATTETTETESTNEANENDMMESSSSSTMSADSTNMLNEVTDSAASADLVEPNSDFCQGTEDVVEYVVQTSESTDGIQQSTCINSALYKEEADNLASVVNPDNNPNYAAIISTSDEHSEIELAANVNVVYMPDNVDNCILIKVDNDSKLMDNSISSNTYYITDSDTNMAHCNVILDETHNQQIKTIISADKKPTETTNIAMDAVHQQQPIVDYQTQTPTLIVQQVPGPQSNVIPYVDTFSQQSAAIQQPQNIQYITIGAGDKNASQYQSTVLSNAYQIQSPASSVQTVVPTVVGTIIQPNGVEQLILNTNPTDPMDIFHRQQPQTGGVYISSPPQMYMNMETVVSNTVMSSSQFVSVPGSVPGGMLSTYSATTTQVFQATKPVIDVPPQSYLVINTSPTVSSAATRIDNSTQQMNAVQQLSQTTRVHTPQASMLADHRSVNRLHHKQCLVDKKIMKQQTVYKQENTNDKVHTLGSTERSTVFIEPHFNTNKPSTLKNEQLKVAQNAQKIHPVHHLSKMVDSIQHSTTRKICLNNVIRHKPPEAKVIPQPKIISSAIQHLNSFEDKLNKTIVNKFNLLKPKEEPPHASSDTKLIMDRVEKKVSTDHQNKDKFASSPIKKQVLESTDKISDDNISETTITNRVTDLKTNSPTDQPKINVKEVLPIIKTESTSTDMLIACSSPSKASDSTANKIRTYSNPKKRSTPVEPCALTQQMKEHFKSQMIKEFNKNTVHAKQDIGIDTNGVRVLQPTLKENKILEKAKTTLGESSVSLKRSKQWPAENNRNSTYNSSKKDLRASEKTVNTKQKSERVKRKDNCNGSDLEHSSKKDEKSVTKDSVANGYDPSSPNMVFEIKSEDGFSCMTPNLVEAWQKVYDAVQAARASKKMPPIPRNPYQSVNSLLKMLGLGNNSLKYVLEQLPGVGRSVKYRPFYHKNLYNFMGHDSVTKENISGCARSEPYTTRNKYDMFSWLASRHRRPPKLLVTSDADIINGNSRRATSLNLPMAMRFRHLGKTSKEAVGVFRSDIHGRGLFCLRDIDSGEMVIEYAGEVIRSALTDKREKYYTSKGIGCYMFRIDDNFVVDATMKGNAARFINHSCEPNCYSRVVDILGKKHILIFALRRIPKGEELTYDYKFPLEDDKITCHCLSRKCRKYLN